MSYISAEYVVQNNQMHLGVMMGNLQHTIYVIVVGQSSATKIPLCKVSRNTGHNGQIVVLSGAIKNLSLKTGPWKSSYLIYQQDTFSFGSRPPSRDLLFNRQPFSRANLTFTPSKNASTCCCSFAGRQVEVRVSTFISGLSMGSVMMTRQPGITRISTRLINARRLAKLINEALTIHS